MKERLQKKLIKDIKIFLQKKNKKSENEKNKLVEYRKKYYKMRKKLFIIIVRKYFNLESFISL